MGRLSIVLALVLLAAPAAAARPPDEDLSRPPGHQEPVPPGLAPAVEALKKGDSATALAMARTFIASQPGSALGHEVLGAAALHRRQWVEAEHALTESLRLEPSRTSVLIRLGQVALGRGDFKKAEERFRQVIGKAPKANVGYRGLAIALARQRKLGAAISAAEQAVRHSPDRDLVTRFELAVLYYDAGRLLPADGVLTQILAIQPGQPSASWLQGMINLDLGKTDEAAALFEHVATRQPQSAMARLGRALVERARGQLPDARAQLEKIVQENPDWSVSHLELGRTLVLQREREAAMKSFDQAERTSLDPAQTRLRTVRVLLAAGQTEPAIDRARSLLNHAVVGPAARALVAQAYLHRKEPAEAERVLRQGADASPPDPAAVVQLGRFYLAQARPKDALAAFNRAASIRADLVEAALGKAEAQAALGDATAAVAEAERVVTLQRRTPDSMVFLGSIHQRLGQIPDAIQAYRAALTADPKNASAVRALSGLYERDGRGAEAVKVLEEAVSANPESSIPVQELGLLLQRQGNVERAISVYRDGLRRAPDDPTLLNNLAYLLSKAPATLAEAATLGERAYKRTPRNPAIMDTYGWVLYQQGAVDRALPLLEDAARLVSGNGTIQYHLGAAYARAGKRDKARSALERALQSPPFEDAEAARALLELLR